MPTQKALDFIVNLRYDRSLRKKMNQLRQEQIHPYLETIGYTFTREQLEEAVKYYMFRFPEVKNQPEFDELKFWYDFMRSVYENQ